MDTMHSVQQDRAVLAGLASDVFDREENATEESLEELEALLETAGGIAVGTLLQTRHTPDPRSFLGEGKAEELRQAAEELKADLIVFDNDLSPSQTKNLEEITGLPVMDRAGVILDIFAQRAKTREGRLQVELAQYQYLLPRLSGMGRVLSRQGGGIGTRGPGETRLETDRRKIRSRIAWLRQELREVERVRQVQRRRRTKNAVPVCAMIGYTNTGKSTLLNCLTDAGIPANNRLFDTLDTTTRRLRVSDTMEVLLSDTVGFIAKLPHNLIEAFHATLEELRYADVLLHVIDASDPEREAHIAVVEQLISEMVEDSVPVIRVYNKTDLTGKPEIPPGVTGCAVSARSGAGTEELLRLIARQLEKQRRTVTLDIPYSRAGELDRIHREASVRETEYTAEGIRVVADLDQDQIGRWRTLIAENGLREAAP